MGDIYKITCNKTNKLYIGQAVHYLACGKKWGYIGRWHNHIVKANNFTPGVYKSSCRALDSAIRKYGKEHFMVEVIKVCENDADLNYWEQFYIKEFNTIAPHGYNLTSGGDSHRKSESTKKLMSEIMKIKGGHGQTNETREKISNSLKNNHEWRKNIIKSNKNKIGKEQKKQPRKNNEDNSLPKYISSKKRNNIMVGYSVHLPNKPTKTFSHSKFTMNEKLQQAIAFLNQNHFNNYE